MLLLAANVVAAGYLLMQPDRSGSIAAPAGTGGRAELEVPPGFVAGVFAEGLAAPRFIAFGPDGRLYVAESGRDRIVALADSTGDGIADVTRVFASGVATPHSVTWHGGALYAGVPSGVVELRDDDVDGEAEKRRVLVGDYPTNGHSTRTVIFLADGRMLVSVGSSCNVCVEEDRRRAAIVAYDKGAEKLFATGLRNAVGLALHPATGELWATNNGRDWLGDDLPPETVNVVKEGSDFGWPRCHGGDLVDPDYGGSDGCKGVAAPILKMQAHSAPLGLVFYTGSAFPPQYHGDLFIAFHGSWNRSVPTGFKVVHVHLEGGVPAGAVEDFATGFTDEKSGRVLGRPVGLAVGPDGALYVSDDRGGFIYRIAVAR